MEKLQCVATTRYCLQFIAKYLKECYSLKPEANISDYEELFRMAADLCDLPIKHIRLIFLMRFLYFFLLDNSLKSLKCYY